METKIKKLEIELNFFSRLKWNTEKPTIYRVKKMHRSRYLSTRKKEEKKSWNTNKEFGMSNTVGSEAKI